MITHDKKTVSRYTVSVGLNDKDISVQKFKTERIINLVTKCCKHYDLAFSCYNQSGGYKSESGDYVLEESISIVLNDPCEEAVEELSKDLCAFLNQETIMVTVEDVECYYISHSIL